VWRASKWPRAAYSAIGTVTAASGVQPALGFTGNLTDPVTGLAYLRATTVGGIDLQIEGKTIDGVFKISTAYVPRG
jgi:hypothetical protein